MNQRTHRIAAPAVVVTVAVWLGAAVTLRSQEIGGSSALKANLDLPYNVAAAAEEEDDVPEVVTFYGQTYESGATFFCLDRSLSMGDGEWEALQRELGRVVTRFSSATEFGIVFFDEEATSYPEDGRPAVATPERKEAAIEMVRSTSPSARSTCFLAGLQVALRMASRAESKRKSIIFMSDGKATCAGEDSVAYVRKTLADVRTLNTAGAIIHTVGVGAEIVEYFLRTLAEQGRGTFRRLAGR